MCFRLCRLTLFILWILCVWNKLVLFSNVFVVGTTFIHEWCIDISMMRNLNETIKHYCITTHFPWSAVLVLSTCTEQCHKVRENKSQRVLIFMKYLSSTYINNLEKTNSRIVYLQFIRENCCLHIADSWWRKSLNGLYKKFVMSATKLMLVKTYAFYAVTAKWCKALAHRECLQYIFKTRWDLKSYTKLHGVVYVTNPLSNKPTVPL